MACRLVERTGGHGADDVAACVVIAQAVVNNRGFKVGESVVTAIMRIMERVDFDVLPCMH